MKDTFQSLGKKVDSAQAHMRRPAISNLNEAWRLQVGDRNGTQWHVLTSQEIGQEAVDEWTASTESGTGGYLTVKGVSDTYDRASLTLTILFESIIAMSLVRMY